MAEVEVVHSEGDEVDKGERDVDDEGVEEDEADEYDEEEEEERRGDKLLWGRRNLADLCCSGCDWPFSWALLLSITVFVTGCRCSGKGVLLLPELWRNTPTSWFDVGLEENTVLGSASAVFE